MALTMKATPRAILKGIRDESTRQLPIEPLQLPQHLPVMFLMTEKSDAINIVGGVAAREIYGDKTFDQMSDFYNHQTVGANLCLKAPNQIMVVPVKMPDAKQASIRIAAEVVAATVEGRNVSRIIWHATEIDTATMPEFGNADIVADYRSGETQSQISGDKLGVLIDVATGEEYHTPSALIPIIDLQVESRGSYGNQYGISIDAPTEASEVPADTALAKHLKTFIYRMSLYNRQSNSAGPNYIYTNYSNTETDFVLKAETVNPNTNINLSFMEVLTESYSEFDNADKPPVYGPFPRIATYQENIEQLAVMLGADYEVTATSATGTTKEFTIPGIYDSIEEATDMAYMVNFLTGVDIEGNKYPTMDLSASRKFGGVRFGKDSVIYAQGGSDGFPMLLGTVDKLKTLEIYDATVRNWCENFTEVNPLYDSAKYPFSCLWDTGFSMATKKALMKPTGQHKRIWSTVATHAIADYVDSVNQTGWRYCDALTAQEEVAVGMILQAYGLLIPESEEFGTPTVRIAIVSRSGNLIDKSYRGRIPLTIEVINKVAKYCGAGNAVWNSNEAFDVNPKNVVELFRDINVTYQSSNVYNKSWDAGLMWVQNFDTAHAFFPAFRTIYPNDTSILTSYISMIACCYIERVCEIVWRRLVGNGKLTDDQFIERCDRMIEEELAGKFDGRFRIVPRTYYTTADKLAGFSWSTDIEFYANNMVTVGKFTVVARRMSDYAASATRPGVST